VATPGLPFPIDHAEHLVDTESAARKQGLQSNRLPILAQQIRDAHADIERGALALAERALAAGNALIEAKAAVPHGQWADWVSEHIGISTRTASRYMKVAASGMKSATVADLGIRAAAEALAATRLEWPLPGPGEALRVVSTLGFPGELEAFIWPDRAGGFNTYVLDGEFVDENGPFPGRGGSCTTNKKPWRGAIVPHVLEMAGLHLNYIQVERVQYASPGFLDEWRAANSKRAAQ
jgi:hypothetical protein